MKSNPIVPKTKAGGRSAATVHQAAFELKNRVALSLNKLADRDTQQIGADELDRIAGGIAADGIAPFLSYVADTDADQKPAVRRECVRAMGVLARAHGAAVGPHLAKMAGSIVKRLKDSDSVVRDACVETAGVLVANGGGSAFVALARPIFEALGEQNRYVQAGSAMCLARVIEDAVDPPASIFPQMLARVVKLLKNPHFMAKPALIELIRSIIQAGGASTEHALSAAVTAILEALKSNDWTTRKAASVALADITVSAGPLLGPFRTSCIQSLECSRFDKVKPVRDAVMHAIQCWKALQRTYSLEPSETGSSTKENFGGDYIDISASDGGWRETSVKKAGPVSALSGNSISSTTKRTPLAVRKTCTNYVQNRHVKSNDWPIEIALPKSRIMQSVDHDHEESRGSCVSKPLERAANATRGKILKCDYELAEDKPECSSMSDLVSGSFETKHVTVAHSCLDEGDSADEINHRSVIEDNDPEDLRLQGRKSLDSTVTESCSRGMHGCCVYAASELSFIRKQLLEIETRQSNLMDLLQVFVGSSTDSLSTLQLKVDNLKHTVDKLTQSSKVDNLKHTVDKLTQGSTENQDYFIMHGSKLLKKNQGFSSSPRLSASTPRPSLDSHHRQPSTLSTRNREMWGEKNVQSLVSTRTEPRIRKRITVDVESAYREALSSCDDLGLIELMDRTGPVLERLSGETGGEILSVVATHFRNHRFLDSILPWLQQVVELSSAHEPVNFVPTTKARMEILLAIEDMEFADPDARASIAQLATKLTRLWGNAPIRKFLPTGRGSRGSRNAESTHENNFST